MNVLSKEVLIALNDVMICDEVVLRRKLQDIKQSQLTYQEKKKKIRAILYSLSNSHKRVLNRRKLVPAISYADNLPINQKRKIILDAIQNHPVTIIVGETGSGKTTQLPKFCLTLGRGVTGMIGHTQPRRLAARSIANHLTKELHTLSQNIVGYKVRFDDTININTLIKLITDGILLEEIRNDRLLLQYDTLIIDEAHERSLNIDFIFGYLRQILPLRPNLKVIITSATVNSEKIARFFDKAPIIEVSGRTYPIEIRYRPVESNTREAQGFGYAINQAVNELFKEEPGDILIFLSGERDIHDIAKNINAMKLPNTEVLPLFARLSNAEQNRIFQPQLNRRIILATNIAETSLTVPRVKYVIDSGIARISRYNYRKKVQCLPVERISQASANQRKGRCGRIAKGICIRLYSEQDFLSRPFFTEPEIKRTHLASVILKMTALGLGDIAKFPFIEVPEKRQIHDGFQLLKELNAIDILIKTKCRLNSIGYQLAALPLDPRLARIVIAASNNDCLQEVIIIVSALSIQDPRERPIDRKEASNAKHCRFSDTKSDFLSFIKLWNYLQEQQKNLSTSKFRRQCQNDFLSYPRIIEWQEIYMQLRQNVSMLGFSINSRYASYQSLHTALLTGLLSHIGRKAVGTQEYHGVRHTKFVLYSTSFLTKKLPKWVMVAELIETNRLWGRIAARIEPEWIEPLASHLVKRSYGEPYWNKETGLVAATEKITLLGLPIILKQRVDYSDVDPVLCRELFIRHALIKGDWETSHSFFIANHKLIQKVEKLESKARRRNIVINEESLFAFYNDRVGKEVVSAHHFDVWWMNKSKSNPEFLSFRETMLIRKDAITFKVTDYPDTWIYNSFELRLSYRFEPESDTDGVTVHIPLIILNQISSKEFEWHIPGKRRELISALLKSLPKPLRRSLIPIEYYADALFERLKFKKQPFLEALTKEVYRMTGITIPKAAWQINCVPNHMRMTFRVIDEQENILGEGKDLELLKKKLENSIQQILLSMMDKDLKLENMQSWSFDDLPRRFETTRYGYKLIAWPSLVDRQTSVAINCFESQEKQQRAMWQGIRRLILLNSASLIKELHETLFNTVNLNIFFNPYEQISEMIDDCIICSTNKLMEDWGGLVWHRKDYLNLQKYVQDHFNHTVLNITNLVLKILTITFSIHKRLKSKSVPSLALYDIKNQINNLVYRGFIVSTGWKRLADVLRYLSAIEYRIDKLIADPSRDHIQMLKFSVVQKMWKEWLNKFSIKRKEDEDIQDIRWMIEEFRISLFAQQIGTLFSVSEKRIQRAMSRVQP